jgi:hypothetical protein
VGIEVESEVFDVRCKSEKPGRGRVVQCRPVAKRAGASPSPSNRAARLGVSAIWGLGTPLEGFLGSTSVLTLIMTSDAI